VIHETAVVDRAATLAADVDIGPYAIIGSGVEIDSGTYIGPHVVLRGPTRIGKNNRIFQFCSVGDEPQDKKYAGEPTRLVIGDGNTIRECCTINRGTIQDAGVTRIGDGNWIMAYVHIAHDCVVGDDNVMANNVTLAGHVRVGDSVIMGGFSGVHQFCQIGSHAFLAMYSVINRDVPAYCMAAGHPAVPRGVNAEGLRRRGFDAEQIRVIRGAYKTLYRSGRKFDDALEEIAASAATRPELEVLVASLRSSTRSIVR
jgi:UDP-N-acetylglucosamine acyltransferase